MTTQKNKIAVSGYKLQSFGFANSECYSVSKCDTEQSPVRASLITVIAYKSHIVQLLLAPGVVFGINEMNLRFLPLES